MMSSKQNVLLSGLSDDSEAAAGSGGTSRVSISASMAYPQNAGSSQAPAANTGVGTATAGGSAKQASVGDRKVTDTATAQMEKNVGNEGTHASQNDQQSTSTPTEASNSSAERGNQRKINIGVLNESELLNMIRGYVNSMADFANKTRNVHKELKDTIRNTGLVLNQYLKIISPTSKGKSVKNTSTQTEDVSIDIAQAEINQSRKTSSRDVSTDTPCWWPMVWDVESKPIQNDSRIIKLNKQQTQQREIEKENGEEFTVVNRKKNAKRQKESPASNDNIETARLVRLPRMRKQAVILDRSTGSTSYADMVRQVKKTVHDGNLEIDIITRKAKSGNVILEIPNKEQADSLAELLKGVPELGDTNIRRPAQTIPLFFMGIEESVDESELRSALEAFDDELKGINNIVIRENSSGLRTAVIRVPWRAGRRLINAKRIKIGWGMCRIKEFDAREQACNKCREKGHFAKDCLGAERRRCFNCKEMGHLIANCNQEIKRDNANNRKNERHTGVTLPQCEPKQ